MNERETRRIRLLALLLFALGAALRLLGDAPVGLNQDEASAGYDAWALLHYGIDRNGDSWPVLFVSWGSGQNVLYSYLALPFLALFGLSAPALRLPAEIAGCLALPLAYLLGREMRDERLGLCFLALLAANPWHIMLSRWALESNLLPFCLLLAATLFLLSRRRPRLLIASAAVFALSLYAYGTAFFIVPVLLLYALYSLLHERRLRARIFFPALALFLLLALPITLCNLRNALGLGPLHLGPLTLPALTSTRQSATTGGSPLTNLGGFLSLLWTQDDSLPWNTTQPFGLLYGPPGLLLALFGLGFALWERRRHRAPAGEGLMLVWLGGSLLAAAFIHGNVNRMNMAFLPLIWFQARGARALLWHPSLTRPLRWLTLSLGALALALVTALFARTYFTTQQQTLSYCFYEGLGEAIACAETYSAERAELPVWVSDSVNAPYIYALFYTRTPPRAFLDSVTCPVPDAAFRPITAFGKYRFGGALPAQGLAVLPYWETARLPAEAQILGEFGIFAVAALQ